MEVLTTDDGLMDIGEHRMLLFGQFAPGFIPKRPALCLEVYDVSAVFLSLEHDHDDGVCCVNILDTRQRDLSPFLHCSEWPHLQFE